MKLIQRIFLILLFFSLWFALIVQFYLNIQNRTVSVAESVIRFFSYFTILTNLLAAICITVSLFNSSKFFLRQSTQTAIAVYIFIVGLIYNVILRSLWNPSGMQQIVDELLHSVNPVLFIFYWALFNNTNKLKWKIIFWWLVYPLTYLIYVFIRGSLSGFYPYPFIDANKLSKQSIFINCIGMTFLFIVVSLIFLATGNMIAKTKVKV